MTEYEFVDKRWQQQQVPPRTPQHDFPNESLQPEAWDLYRDHRHVVTALILGAVRRKMGDVSLWGAGACQDVELDQLGEHFNRITLVDIDEKAMEMGMRAQDVLADERYIQMIDVDLAGVKNDLEAYARQPSPAALQAMIDRATNYTPPIDLGKQLVIASNCMLSQLICKVDECLPEKDQSFIDLMAAVRQRHIELMVENLSPGGIGLLITDFNSSDALPAIATTNDLTSTLKQGIDQGNFLHGLNPFVIQTVFSEPHIASQINPIQVSKPWRWRTSKRIYACIAFKFEKKA